jgi:hypothetical protein
MKKQNKKVVAELTNEVIEYLFDEEKKHYEEYEKKPKDHIYLKLLKLKKLNNPVRD